MADGLAIFGGFLLATWIRFDILEAPLGRDPDLYTKYGQGAFVTTLVFLFIFRRLALFVRPQLGRFENKIPRIVRACGLGVVAATVLALDPQTGMPLALMEGDSLTALRTGAAGGVAARYLARADAENVALFGAGVQARAQLQAAMAVRKIERVWIVDPFESTARRLADDIAGWPDAPAVTLADSPQSAVAQADIVLAATTATTPLFDGNELKPGTHVTGVGSFTPQMQEIDANTIRRARVVVDQRDAAMAEAGDIIIAKATIDAEIGEIINGDKPGRQNDEEITFFKSVGLAVQDAVTAGAVLKAAEEKGLGTVIHMS